jgi:hypothetical protein
LDIYKLVFQDSSCIKDGKWILEDGLDWAPDIDDLEAAFQESFSFVWEFLLNDLWGIAVALINVSISDWALKVSRHGVRLAFFVFGSIFLLALAVQEMGVRLTNYMMKDVYFVRTRPAAISLAAAEEFEDQGGLHFVQEVGDFGVISILDGRIIREILYHALVIEKLDASCVEGVFDS